MFALTLLLGAALAASPTPTPTPALDDAIAAAVKTSIDFNVVPGAAVAVSRDGVVVYARGFGKRNVARDLPVTSETAFEIGSATKQFTAAEILQLQEAHKLSIDDRLAKYLPSFPHAKDVTLRELLNQTSGLPDYITDDLLITPLVRNEPTHAQLQARVKGPLHFAPGTQWEYSNTNYLALGWVVEKVSHVSWEAYTRKNIYARANMTHSGFFSDEPHMSNFAQPYDHGANGKGSLVQSPPIANGWAGGAGAIVSTLADMAAWDDALEHGRVVSASDYALMTTPPSLAAKSALPYGMGLARDNVDGHLRIWHNGGTGGSRTMDACFPEDHVCVIVFENEMNASPEAVSTAVFEAVVPEARQAARAPAPGEDPAITARVRAIFDGLQHGTLKTGDLTLEARKHFTPQLLATAQQQLAPLGAPSSVIYKGKRDVAGETEYTYRFEFTQATLILRMDIDTATNLVSGVHILPG